MFHKAAPVSKTIPKGLYEHMSVVIIFVNYVKSSAFNTRLFSKLCKDTTFIPHSSSLAVKREHALSYFRTKRRSQVACSCKTKTRSFVGIWWRRIFYIAYLSDIFEALNQLNKKLQGPGTNTIVHSDAINAFVVKLNLWRQRAKNNNFASFHRLTEITEDDFNKNLKEDIISRLRYLQDEFERYFSEINTDSILMKVARNPFILIGRCS